MDKLPSRNHEKLLLRISHAAGGKIVLSDLSEDDRNRFSDLQDRNLVQFCDAEFPPNDPSSSVIFIGPVFRSAMLSTAGKDYLSELQDERRENLKRFGRDILMMILGALITFLFDKLIS